MSSSNLYSIDSLSRYGGKKQYELSNHLGNVVVSISDRKVALDNNSDNVIDDYEADVVTVSDYYAYGSPMPGRTSSSDEYRYGFGGYEADNEVSQDGNSYTSHFRQYDPRLGRWKTTDPVIHPGRSSYESMDSNPIRNTDPLGDNVPFSPNANILNSGASQVTQVATKGAGIGMSLAKATINQISGLSHNHVNNPNLAGGGKADPPLGGKGKKGMDPEKYNSLDSETKKKVDEGYFVSEDELFQEMDRMSELINEEVAALILEAEFGHRKVFIQPSRDNHHWIDEKGDLKAESKNYLKDNYDSHGNRFHTPNEEILQHHPSLTGYRVVGHIHNHPFRNTGPSRKDARSRSRWSFDAYVLTEYHVYKIKKFPERNYMIPITTFYESIAPRTNSKVFLKNISN